MIDLRTIDEMTRKLADSLPPGLTQKKAELEALPAKIEELVAARDVKYDEAQGALADFLNVALNDYPEHPATADRNPRVNDVQRHHRRADMECLLNL